jgi:hypothetical protein
MVVPAPPWIGLVTPSFRSSRLHSVYGMTTTQLDVTLVPAPAARIVPRLGTDTRYVLTGLPLALASVLVAVSSFAVGLGLAVLWIGVPMMIFALGASRRLADLERARIARVLDRPVEDPAYRTTGATHPLRRLATALTDPQSWRDLAHAALRFIPNTIAFVLTATWWAAMLGSLTWAAWGWALPDGPDDHDLPEMLGIAHSYSGTVLFYLALGAAFTLTLPAVVRGAALLEARFSRALLTR